MKKSILTFAILLITNSCFSQSVIGKWKAIDDVTGEAKSVVEIYEKSGKIYGKIIEIFDAKERVELCTKCGGNDKNKPILDMIILKGLSKDGEEYNGGTILDPQNGKTYKCYINLESANKLKVRGYIGFALLGRSQYWLRVK
jgi:uncharacterized protein (DUF2147 family)